MGKINFRFSNSNKNQNSNQLEFQHQASIQNMDILYGISEMKKIEFEEDDFTIEIDFANNIRKINWNDYNYPNEKIKGKVVEIAYYSKKADELKEILFDIELCQDEDGNKLKRLGESAVNLINKLSERKHFTTTLFHKQTTVTKIKYTLNKEVALLIKYIKQRKSNKKKNEVLNDAIRHLKFDIENSIIFMTQFETT